MLILPLVSLVFFSGKQFINAQQVAAQSLAMSDLINMAIAANDLIDQLIAEKEITEKYQKARGKKFGDELEVERGKTNQQEEKLYQSLTLIRSSNFSESFTEQVDGSKALLAQLEEKRSAINNKKLRRDKAANFYSSLTSSLLETIGLLPAMSPSKDAAIISAAYSNFLQIKNLAVIERKVLTNVFKNDQFVGKEFSTFNDSVNGQRVYESVYFSLASKQQQEFYNATVTGEFVEKTAAMRAKAFEASDYGAFGIDPAEWVQQQTGKIVLLNKVANTLTLSLKEKATNLGEQANSTLIWSATISILSIVITLLLGFMIQKGIRESVEAALHAVQKITRGDLTGNIQINSTDELGDMLISLQQMQSDLKERIEKDSAISQENARIKQALDNVSANVMVADNNNDIVYLNEAGLELFTNIESAIQSDIPTFKAANLKGANIDQFHKNPSYQHDLVEGLSGTHRAEFSVGGRHMYFIANSVKDEHDNRIGTVVEWTDRTEEVLVEQEIETIISSAKAGDLECRINTNEMSGFILNLSEGINAMVKEISFTLNDIKHVMSSLSHGDLTQSIDSQYMGTFGEVSDHVNETISQFARIIGDFRASTTDLTNTAVEISTGNNNLSARTEQQASALEETASSMEELTSIVKQNSSNAQQANALALSAREVANKGGEVVDGAINAMTEINTSSNKIAEIIGVIDEIAFQTNLLALNASVEAARAGEQGRGFAVVATEVRNLAQRSATAAKEIKELINDSVKKVEAGSALVNESGVTLTEIVQGIKKVGDIVGEIAAAGEEQAQGIEQVNNAVASMDEMTQQNAALAEETSAASVNMTEGANNMLSQMRFFKVNQNDTSTAYQAPAVAAVSAAIKPKKEKKFEPTPSETETESAHSVGSSDDWEEF